MIFMYFRSHLKIMERPSGFQCFLSFISSSFFFTSLFTFKWKSKKNSNPLNVIPWRLNDLVDMFFRLKNICNILSLYIMCSATKLMKNEQNYFFNSCFPVVFILPDQRSWPQLPQSWELCPCWIPFPLIPKRLISCFSLFLLILADVVH